MKKSISPLVILTAWIMFILIFTPEMPAQVIRCFYCKGEITGEYLVVDGNYYHPEHFLCKYCGKPIEGSFRKELENYYHLDCYDKVSSTIYAVPNVGVPKCSVCLQPMEGDIKIDIYGNKFHSWHVGVLDQCDICGRLICDALTGGGRYYEDGRHICNLCYEKTLYNQPGINDLLTKVMDKLISMGISLNKNNISVQVVDKNELKRISGMEKFKRLEGFCNSESQTDYVNGIKNKTGFNHKIYVLSGLPPLNIEGILAHELMHAWVDENTPGNQLPDVREGSCNFISFQYLLYSSDPDAKYLLLYMDKNTDPVYGLGFQKIKNK